MATDQQGFDRMIGALDRILSEMLMATDEQRNSSVTRDNSINGQTLKHHAEDMVLAGVAILRKLRIEEQKIQLLFAKQ